MKLLALASVAALGLVACAGAQPPSPTASLAPTGFQTPDLSVAHAYPELEALLPSEIAGVPLDRFSFAPGEAASQDVFLSSGLTTIDRSAAELEIATAVPSDEQTNLTVVAYRLPGKQPAELAGLIGPDDVDGTIEASSIGGKDVLLLTEAAGVSIAYANSSALFIVAGDRQLAEAALIALP